jgi:hypothetical protein
MQRCLLVCPVRARLACALSEHNAHLFAPEDHGGQENACLQFVQHCTATGMAKPRALPGRKRTCGTYMHAVARESRVWRLAIKQNNETGVVHNPAGRQKIFGRQRQVLSALIGLLMKETDLQDQEHIWRLLYQSAFRGTIELRLLWPS